MITVNNLRDYTAQVMEALPGIQKAEVAVVKEDLIKFMQDMKKEDNIMMLSVLPDHAMEGEQDSAKYVNICGFYFLEKTTQHNKDHQAYLDVFARTQAVAKAFMDKLMVDKSTNQGLFCGFLAWLQEASFTAIPVRVLADCNGFYVQINIKSNP
ncbi:hypothetical protein [Flavobacterium rhizosphaerae]|uniref:Uncharacterized protein n=1 Tax=Flavobacterium rhizosphaerae TaxID=3163298 RepID=A0ABW8YWW2_9FLAO